MDTPLAFPEPVEIPGKGKQKNLPKQLFDSMRGSIDDVYPDSDKEAWGWTDEKFNRQTLTPPAREFTQWLKKRFNPSDEFSQQLTQHLFGVWNNMEENGFRANGMELFDHQKALFAWIALSTASGTREQISNLLVRSPYGSGKSLVGGLVVEAFHAQQLKAIQKGVDPKTIPTGALLGLRKEHMVQNAMGAQYSVLQPPYTVDRKDVVGYWNNLALMFGADFSDCFSKPHGKKHDFFALFDANEGEEDEVSSSSTEEKLETYLKTLNEKQAERWGKVKAPRKKQILNVLESLAGGNLVLVRDIYNVPQPENPLPREQLDEGETTSRYRGDSAFSLVETDDYRIKSTHPHLAPNRETYTNKPNAENPAQFCIAYGSMLTRAAELVRADVREEVLNRARLLVIDEAGKYGPPSLGDTMSEVSGEWPFMLGLTGQDLGIEGWTERSPVLSVQQMIKSKLMKPIAFAGIGNAQVPAEAGSEEAWKQYEKIMFANEQTATALGLPQPYELDTVVVPPTANVREYAHRIKEAHEKQKIPAKVWAFDGSSGGDRWNIIVNGFNAPKLENDPKRILVTAPSLIAEALRLRAECYDILTKMNHYALDQARGRLGHIRNNIQGKDAEKARTYFRVQWLQGGGEAYIREVAEMMGYELPAEGATWTPLQCMIDAAAYKRDQKRENLSTPVPIPDSLAIQKRKRRKEAPKPGTPLKSTSEFVLERERKKAERDAKKNLATHTANGKAALKEDAPSTKNLIVTAVKEKDAKDPYVSKIHLAFNASGDVINLQELANTCGINPYLASLTIAATQAHKDGKRGEVLGQVILKEINRLCGVAERRGNLKKKEHSDSSDRIEMRLH